MPSREPGVSKGHLPEQVPAGLAGLRPKGTCIAACLLAAGHRVTAVDKDAGARRIARNRIRALLAEAKEARFLKGDPAKLLERLRISADYAALESSDLVIESAGGSVRAERQAIRAVERTVSPKAVIACHAPAALIGALQEGALHPERILGIHWGEPPDIARSIEVVCGPLTAPAYAEGVLLLSRRWGKEPILLQRDIRGFVSNRILCAMLREAFHLVESGAATIEDVDRSVRGDIGSWLGFAGPFRFLDLTGINDAESAMVDLLPELSSETRLPARIRKLRRAGAEGVSNARGFYSYTPGQARRWEASYRRFCYDLRAVAARHARDLDERP